MFFNGLKFPPNEPNDEHIECGDKEKCRRMSMGESVQLIEDKKEVNSDSGMKSPDLPSEQADRERDVHDAVDKEIPCGEKLRAGREVREEFPYSIGEKVSGVLTKLMLRKKDDKAGKRAR